MKINRKENAKRNIFFGVLYRIYTLFMPFVIRTFMIYYMGIYYVGLNSLFTSILQVMNLAELGIASAMNYSMYQPIIDDDEQKICSLLNLYRKYYKLVGLVILLCGIFLLPFVPKLINPESIQNLPNEINIYVLFILNVLTIAFSYLLFGYRNSIFFAHQRNDVINKISIAMLTIQYLFQIIAIIIFKNYYFYVIFSILCQILINIFIYYFSKKMFPALKPFGDLKKSERDKVNHRIKDLFISKFSTIILTSSTPIIISRYLGLDNLAIYQNYYYIISSLVGIIIILFNSCSAGIANSLLSESEEKNYRDFINFTFIISWIAIVFSSILIAIYQPFMKLWVGELLMLNDKYIVLFVAWFFVQVIYQLLILYKDVAGIWSKDKYRSITLSFSNLIICFFSIKYYGLIGALISNIVVMLFIGIPWLLINIYIYIFKNQKIRKYILMLFKNSLCFLFSILLVFLVCSNIFIKNIFAEIICKTILSFIIVNICLLIINYKNSDFKNCIDFAIKLLPKKIQTFVAARKNKREG